MMSSVGVVGHVSRVKHKHGLMRFWCSFFSCVSLLHCQLGSVLPGSIQLGLKKLLATPAGYNALQMGVGVHSRSHEQHQDDGEE